MSDELNATIDVGNVLAPYNLCSKEEKAERRRTAVRLALIMKYKRQDNSKQNNEKLMSVEEIVLLIGVPRSNLFRWLGMEEVDPGSGMVGYKTGPKKKH
jgi:hypothetical protein